MKIGRGLNIEHIKRMTLRTVRESTEGQPEFLAFMNALEKCDYDESKCRREVLHLEQAMTAKINRQAAAHRSTLNYHVIRMVKGMYKQR
ncbi:TPA: hypothetical protein N0F65_004289 [Lagenidium giganteum]|uniref:Uncharacterized protein n=1 Tax=Lagenidium giganteum TaxID=4803 RepID=A0AAV2Z9T0_9STRA|nr:TPA: hypothetical protein N0F65_004289 [Lagenidium giganteum]